MRSRLAARRAAVPPDERLDRALIAIQVVTTLGFLLSILDTTIVNVALETFSRHFDAPLSSVQWVATSYLLALGTVVPLAGWTAERFGAKRVWMASVALFVLGSVACGLAWSLGSLVGFRVLQGVGGGLMIPVGQTILAQAAGPKRMARAMALSWIVTLMGPVLGPVIGGGIVDGLSWRWLFYVNVPVGAVALAAAARLLPGTRSAARSPLDVRGLLLLSPGLVLLLYGISGSARRRGAGRAPWWPAWRRAARSPPPSSSTRGAAASAPSSSSPSSATARSAGRRSTASSSSPRSSGAWCCCRSTTRSCAARARCAPGC